MKTKTIQGLNIEDCRILKKISIIADRNYGESEIGQIFYKRKINENYNFIKQAEADKIEKNRFENLLYGYPREENYPNDEFDDLILDGIKYKYPKSIVKNDLILFNSDLENLEILKNQNLIPAKLYFIPKINDTSRIFLYAGKEFNSPEFDLNIYSNYSTEFQRKHIFNAEYDIESQDVNYIISNIEFE